MIVFDIETGPLPPDELPPFDRSTVKLGNLKDPDKIEAKYADAERDYVERAALSATTGRVLAIGVIHSSSDATSLVEGGDEPSVVRAAWEHFEGEDLVVGFNSRAFDLPFLFRRSLILGIDLPAGFLDPRGYWSPRFVDLLDRWRCGDRTLYVKLDDLAHAFGIEGKLEGVSGADFARLWEEDRERAVAYLRRDVEVTRELALAMGV